LQKETIESELIFNITANQTRGILLENQVPQEIYCESKEHPDLVGKIFKGKVIRLLPNIKAAFIDIGLDKAAFMPFSKITDDNDGYLTIPEIQRHNLSEGSNHLVQIVKNPVDDKGAKVTKLLTLPSRYFVYLINDKGIGVSSKIKNDKEREKLNNLVTDFINKNDLSYGLIVRTMAENVSEDILLADLERLCQQWSDIQKKSTSMKSVGCIYEELPLPFRILRDLPTRALKNIRIDSESSVQMLSQYIVNFLPDSHASIKFYEAGEPIFQKYNIENCIQGALNRSVSLPAGGCIVFDHTEAMTTIDVNSGSFAGKVSKNEMAFHVNSEAIKLIAQQLRLRNIGGIIVIDLIDMTSNRLNRAIYEKFKEIMLSDTLKHHIFPISQIGLIEMTREQNRDSLYQIMCESCPTCKGLGFEISSGTLFYEMIRQVKETGKRSNNKELIVTVGQKIYSYYNDYGKIQLKDLEKHLNKKINISLSLYDDDFYITE